MAESYSVEAVLSAVDKSFTSGFKKAMNAVESYKSKASEAMSSVSKTIGVAGAVTTAFGVKALTSFGDFNSALNKAAVTAGGTSKDIDGLAKVANKMGADLPLSAQDSAEAMVEMAQAGADVSTIKRIFPAIAKAATASGADLQATASVVQQAMNIWGKSVGSSEQVAATFTAAANLSNASVEDMQQVMADVGATAKQMGLSLQDTSTAVGLLTNKGIPAAQAAQNMNFALQRMIKPSKSATGVMDQLGISYFDTQGKMKPLAQILQELNSKTAGLTQEQKANALSVLFGQAGYKVMSNLMDSVADKSGKTTTSWWAMNKALKDVSSSSEVANKTLSQQAAEMQKNIGAKVEQVSGNWESLRNSSMSAQSTVLGAMLDMINGTMKWASESKSGIANVIRSFVGLSPVIGVAMSSMSAFLGVANGLNTFFGETGTLKTFGRAIVNPWTIGLTAVVAFTAVLVKAYQQSEPLQKAVAKIGNAFNSVFGPSIKNATKWLNQFWSGFTGANGAKSAVDTLAGSIGNGLAGALNKINWEKVFGTAKSIIDGVSGALKGLFDMVSSVAGKFPILTQVFGNSNNAAVVLLAGITALVVGFNPLSSIIGAIGGKLGGLTSTIGGVGSVFAKFSGSLTTMATGPLKVLSGGLGGVVTKMVATGSTSGALSGVLGTLGSVFGALVSPIALIAGAIAAVTLALGVGGMFTSVTGITTAMTKFGTTVATVAPIVGTTFGNVIKGMLTAIATAIPGIATGALTIMTTLVNTLLVNLPQIISTASKLIFVFVTTLTTLMPQIIAGGLLILSSMLVGIASGLPALVASATQLIVSFLGAIAVNLPQIVVAGSLALISFVNGIISVLPELIATGAKFIITLLGGLAQQMPGLITAGLNVILQFIIGLTNNMGRIITTGVKFVVSIVTGIANNIGRIVTAGIYLLGKFVGAILDHIDDLVDLGLKIIVGLFNALTSPGNIQKIFSAGVKIFNDLVRGIKSVAQQLVQVAAYLLGRFIYGLLSLPSRLMKSGSSVAASFMQGIRGKNYDAKKAGQGVSGNVKDGLGAQMGNIGIMGWNTIIGFTNGINKAAHKAWDAAKNVAHGVANTIGKFLHIGSPSKLMKQYGRWTSIGFAIGINDKAVKVTDAAQDLAEAAVPSMKTVGLDYSINPVSSNIVPDNVSGNLDVNMNDVHQSANINLDLGGRNYHAFVEDISNEQAKKVSLQLKY